MSLPGHAWLFSATLLQYSCSLFTQREALQNTRAGNAQLGPAGRFWEVPCRSSDTTGTETAHAFSFTVFDRNLTFLPWHVHKDGVSHQTPSFHCCQTKVCVCSLELGGCFKGLQLPGGWRGPAEHHCPEERALSWADGSTVTAPHGVENSPPSHPLLQQAVWGQSGQGRVRCGPAAFGGAGGRMEV